MADVIEIAGPLSIALHPDAGNIRFTALDGSTTLLLRHDGKCFVRGEQVDDNKAFWEAFMRWMVGTGILPK